MAIRLTPERELALWTKCSGGPYRHACDEFTVKMGPGLVRADGGRCWTCGYPEHAHDLYAVLSELRALRGDTGDPT